MAPDPDLDSAYALGSIDATKELYADWAETYDKTFAAAMDFMAPRHVAGAYMRSGARGPILDFGAGTGVLGELLSAKGLTDIDALDISPEMLAIAQQKAVYRSLIEGDIRAAQIPDESYTGIVSSGTFTHSHVGPEAIGDLLRVTRSGGQFAISINTQHYASQDFQGYFASIAAEITDLTLTEVRFYGPTATGPHKDDTGLITTFRKR